MLFESHSRQDLPGLYGVRVLVILIKFQTGLPGLFAVIVHVILITFQTGLPGLYI